MLDDRLAKIQIEKHVKELGAKNLKWTYVKSLSPYFYQVDVLCHRIIRPGFFMENFEGSLGSITFGVLKAGLKPSTTIQLIVRRRFLVTSPRSDWVGFLCYRSIERIDEED